MTVAELLAGAAAVVVVTLGPDGCRLFAPAVEVAIPGIPVEPVDVTGAGDTFGASFIHAFDRTIQLPPRPSRMSQRPARARSSVAAPAWRARPMSSRCRRTRPPGPPTPAAGGAARRPNRSPGPHQRKATPMKTPRQEPARPDGRRPPLPRSWPDRGGLHRSRTAPATEAPAARRRPRPTPEHGRRHGCGRNRAPARGRARLRQAGHRHEPDLLARRVQGPERQPDRVGDRTGERDRRASG